MGASPTVDVALKAEPLLTRGRLPGYCWHKSAEDKAAGARCQSGYVNGRLWPQVLEHSVGAPPG
jgi:hypothetical protein